MLFKAYWVNMNKPRYPTKLQSLAHLKSEFLYRLHSSLGVANVYYPDLKLAELGNRAMSAWQTINFNFQSTLTGQTQWSKATIGQWYQLSSRFQNEYFSERWRHLFAELQNETSEIWTPSD